MHKENRLCEKVRMDYKSVLIHKTVDNDDEFISITWQDLEYITSSDKQNSKRFNQTDNTFTELPSSSYDNIVAYYTSLTKHLEEYGFFDKATAKGFLSIVQKHMLNPIDIHDEGRYGCHESDEIAIGNINSAELLPHEERCLYEK